MSTDDAVMIGISVLEKILEHVEEGERADARRRIADAIDAEVGELRSSAQRRLDERRRGQE